MTARPFRAAAIALFAGLSACSAADPQEASERIRVFHAAFNDGRIGTIAAMTAPAFRAGATPFLGKVRVKLGRVVHARQVNWRVNYGTGGVTTVIQQATEFEHGKGQETFVFVEQGGTLLLNGYNLNSADLI
ncbi:MAG: hypothetical protein PGN08_00525 [Sphingomonas taxi]